MASLAIGPGADGVVYDPERHLAFIPSGGDGTLSVIRLSAVPEVITRIATARGARTAALDPVTGRISLPSADYAAPVGTARRQAIPCAFAVIVVGPAPANGR